MTVLMVKMIAGKKVIKKLNLRDSSIQEGIPKQVLRIPNL